MFDDILVNDPALSEEPQLMLRRPPQLHPKPQPQVPLSLAPESWFTDVNGSLLDHETEIAFRCPACCCSSNMGLLDPMLGFDRQDPDQRGPACVSTRYLWSCVDEPQNFADKLETINCMWYSL